MAVMIKAPAKVNWHLAVGERRADGYHPISSIFQTCSICDELEIEISEGPFSISVHGLEGVCEKGHSTLDKAARLWHAQTGFDKSVYISLRKRIPSQAGMGGGSSDAASLLLYLNSIAKKPLTCDALMALGAKVGCDVPFFISQTRAAYVSGLGEIVQPITAKEDLRGFVIIPKVEKISTKEAYDALDAREEILELESMSFLVKEYQKPVSMWDFRNDFTLVNKRPEIEVLPGECLLLTGSGSCWILLSDRPFIESAGNYEVVPVTF